MTRVIGGFSFLTDHLKARLLLFINLLVRLFHFLAKRVGSRAQLRRMLAQLRDSLLSDGLLSSIIFQRALKFGSYRGLGLISPQASAKRDFALDVAHSSLNLKITRVELSLVVVGVLEFIFQFCQTL